MKHWLRKRRLRKQGFTVAFTDATSTTSGASNPASRSPVLRTLAGLHASARSFLLAFALSLALSAAGLSFASTASAQTAEPMTLNFFREHRRAAKRHLNVVRVEKCREPARFYRTARSFSPPHRPGNLARWRERAREAPGLSSRCLSSRMWNWFYVSGASCIKAHEGAWTSATGNGYFGGFQADLSFQAAYGGEYLSRYGTANHWPAWKQIHMAYRGHAARGWSPWPTTRVICGL